MLAIDDDPLVRDLLIRHLAPSGYHVVTADGGEEGLRLARELRPDAITLDVLMPQMDGWAVLKALKDDPEVADIPVVMLTIIEEKNLGFSLGAAEYLAKPIEPGKLLGILERHCGGVRGAKVLVVEDHAPTRLLVRRLLETEDCTVIEAENGRHGLERLAEGGPDLIVLDLMMPEMDGFEFLSQRLADPDWRAVPVVVVTAKKLTAADRRRLNGGVEMLLQKGDDDPKKLLPLLRDAIARRKAAAAPAPRPRLPAAQPKPKAVAPRSDEVPLIQGSVRAAGRAPVPGHILVVDDLETNRDLLARQLANEGHTVTVAEGGVKALAVADTEPFDVVLLDLMMPDLNGMEVLARLKADGRTENTPVIMISAHTEEEKAVQCLEIGAEDYLSKPFSPVLLRTRINSCIDRKRAKDRSAMYFEELGREKQNTEELLLNILPSQIVERINAGEELIADRYEDVTVLFSDLVGFTNISNQMGADQLVRDLNHLFSQFDELAKTCGVEKVKTIGDAYMGVAGLPQPVDNAAAACAEMALGMVEVLDRVNPTLAKPFDIRVGLHSGPVVAGIIGKHKYVYDVWGTTLNHASRYESYSVPGGIHVSARVAAALGDGYVLESRGVLQMRSIGEVETFFLKGRR